MTPAQARVLAQQLYDLERHAEAGQSHFASWTLEEFVDELLLDQSDIFLWSAESGRVGPEAAIDGFVFSRGFNDESEIMDLAVRHKGRGHGVRLVEAFLLRAQELGIRNVFLEVAAGNLAAIRTYQRCGFRRQQIRPNYYRDGQDAWVMAWEKQI